MRRALVAALILPLLAGCGSGQDDYCGAVQDHAPDDIAGEWKVLVDDITAFGDAVRAAGVDPATYDPKDPSISAEDRKAIEAASRRLASPETLEALRAVDQEVRDVCHTPLTM